MFIDKNKAEEILNTLDVKKILFPGYEIAKSGEQLKLIGSGGFSNVYEMKCPDKPECKFALKVIGFERHVLTSENFKNVVALQESLSEQSPYICRIIETKENRIVLNNDGELCEVYDVTGERWDEEGIHLQFVLMECLEEVIKKDRFGKILLLRKDLSNEDGVIDFAIEIGQALHCAHSNNVLHRDVKLENIFWDEKSSCYKLGDFGISKYSLDGTAETIVYTDGYGAPEIEKQLSTNYNLTADIYSLGITLYLLLNDFKFPGSNGYYANIVQYNPEFVFPAPIHASDNMVRIIRRMCQYHHNDRYKSMAEVLVDLSALKTITRESSYEEINLPDVETETYKGEQGKNNFTDENVLKQEEYSRYKRKEDELTRNEIYKISSVLHFIGFTLLITFLMKSMHNGLPILQEHLLLFFVMVLIETFFLCLKEFHVLFGMLTLGVGLCLGLNYGFSVPYVILLFGIITGVPVVSGATVTSVILWFLIEYGKIELLEFINNYELSWILLVLVLFLLSHYMFIRIECDKTSYIRARIGICFFSKIYILMIAAGILLFFMEQFRIVLIPGLLKQLHLFRTGIISHILFYICMIRSGYLNIDEEEQLYEDKMDERGDGKCSDTIE